MLRSQGPFNPGSAGQINLGSPPSNNWFNQNDILTSNDVYASSFHNSATSNMITAYNYGFNIPNDALVSGIVFTIERQSSENNRTADLDVYAIKDANIFAAAGTNQASGQKWTTSDVIFSYGKVSDLWGQAWSPSDINASGFGLGLAISYGAGGGSSGFVDNIQATVYYDDPPRTGVFPLYICGDNGITIFSQGPRSPRNATAINIGSPSDRDWISPQKIFASDNTYASSIGPSTTSNLLLGDDFGFNIPSGASILGFTAGVEHRADIPNRINDNSLQILKDRAFIGGATNKATSTKWANTDEIASYGSVTDMWGLTGVTYDYVNSSGFGLGLTCAFNAGGTGYVDNMNMTVFYSFENKGMTLYEYGHAPSNSGMTLFEWGHIAINSGMSLYVSGVGFSSLGVPLYIGDNGNRIDKGMTLYLKNPGSDSGMPLSIWGLGDANSINGAIPRNGSIYLFINGQGQQANIPLFTSGNGNINNNIPLYISSDNFLETTFSSGVRDWTIADLSVQPILWLKADAVGSGDGTPMSTWFDSTSNHNDFSQSTPTNKPTLKTNIVNGLPVVRFDGVDDLLTNGVMPSAVQPTHYAFVINPTSPAGLGNWFQNNQAFIQSTSPNKCQMFGGAGVSQTGLMFDAFHVHTCLWSGVQSAWYIDGGSLKTGDTSTTPFGRTSGQHKLNDTSFPSAYDLPELLIFDYALHPLDRQQVEGYLAWKYGLQNNLPTSHLFKNNKPTIQTPPNPIGVTLVIPSVIASSIRPLNLYSHGF